MSMRYLLTKEIYYRSRKAVSLKAEIFAKNFRRQKSKHFKKNWNGNCKYTLKYLVEWPSKSMKKNSIVFLTKVDINGK